MELGRFFRRSRCASAVLLLWIALPLNLAASPSNSSFEGRWVGLLADSGNFANVGFEFKTADEEVQAFFFSDDMDVDPMPTGKATVQDRSIQSLLFTGTLTPDGKTLEGTIDFKAFGMPLKLPLTLTRSAEGERSGSAPKTEEAAGKTAHAAWEFNTEAPIYASPLVTGNSLYVGSDDGYLYALDAKTGQLQWKLKTAGAVRSRAAVGSGVVYFTSDDGFLYALDSRTGKLKWKFDTKGSLVPHSVLGPGDQKWDYLQSSPAVSAGTVLVGSSNSNLYAVDCTTGQEKWHFTSGDTIRSSPIVHNNTVYFGSWDNHVYALDLKTGLERWKFDTQGIVQATPLISPSGLLLIGSRYPYLFALDAHTGTEKWRFNYLGSWVESSAAVAGDTVFIGSSDFVHLFAIDLASGRRKWGFKTSGYAWSSPAVVDGAVYIGNASVSKRHKETTPDFYAVEAKTGREIWRLRTGRTAGHFIQGVVSSPAVAGGIVYFGSLDGKVYAVPVGG